MVGTGHGKMEDSSSQSQSLLLPSEIVHLTETVIGRGAYGVVREVCRYQCQRYAARLRIHRYTAVNLKYYAS